MPLRHSAFALVFVGSLVTHGAIAATDSNSPNSAMRYAAVETQSDSENNRQSIATLSLTLGDHWWANASGGKIHTQQATTTSNPSFGSLGVGVAGQSVQFTLAASSRKDGSSYRQRDWGSSLDWHNERFGLGVDGMHRNTDVEAVAAVVTSQGNIINVPVAQSLSGNGFGLRGSVNVTERLNLFLGGMRYNYDVSTRQNGSVTVNGGNNAIINTLVNNLLSNRPLLAQQLLVRTSGVTRDEAILDSSYNIGMSYQFTDVALTAQYFNDKAFDSDDVAATLQLSAAIFIGKHWMLMPGIGRSSSDLLGDVTFGSLSASFAW